MKRGDTAKHVVTGEHLVLNHRIVRDPYEDRALATPIWEVIQADGERRVVPERKLVKV